MNVLTLFTDYFSESSPQLTFFTNRCLRARLNTNQCQRCVESCPTGALGADNRKIDIASPRCTGCMSCVAACPQDALVSNYDLGELLRSFQKNRDIIVSCHRQTQSHPDEIIIPCVGIISKQLLTTLVFSGCRSVTFNLAGCRGCCNEDVSTAFRIDCKKITDYLSESSPAKVTLVDRREQLSHHIMDRRAYLAKLRNIATDISIKNISPARKTGPEKPGNSRRIPFKTELVKNILAHLDEDSQKKVLSLCGHNLSINEGCDCCPLCKGICPSGAIKIDRSEQGKRFKFRMLNCSGCGLCVEFCKKNAISLDACKFH